MKTPFALLAAIMMLTSTELAAQKSAKQAPPPPSAPRPFAFPKAATKTLANGLQVYVIQDHRLPLVSASLQVLAGGAYAPPSKAGLANMTATLLREGTKTRKAQDIARAVDNAGGSLTTSAGDDTATVSMTFMKSYAPLGFELMSDVLLNPVFDQDEIDRNMRQAQSGLQVNYASAEYLAPLVAARAILGTHPYAYPGDGTPDTLRNIKREDIVRFYEENYGPNRAWLAIAGDVTPEEGFAIAEKYFGRWQSKAGPDVPLPAPPAPRNQVVIVDMPAAVQTQIVVGHLGVKRSVSEYAALNLGNQIVGGSFNSRINMKLRANEGLTYGANSSFDPNRQAGLFTASTFTRTEKTAEAIRFLLDVLKEAKANPATDEEFAESQAYLAGSFALAVESAGGVAGRTLTAAINGLGDDYWPNYTKLIQSLTREQVAKAFSSFLQTDKLAIVAVGNAKEFARQLEVFGPVRVIPVAELDLAAPDMVRVKEKVEMSAAGAAKAKSLLEAAAAAMGGKEKLAAVKDQTISAKIKLTLPQGAFDGESTESFLYPDRYKLVLKLPVAEITQVLDGDKAWMGQGNMVQELPAQLLAAMKQNLLTGGTAIGLLNAALDGKAQTTALDPVEAGGRKLTPILIKLDGLEAKLLVDAATSLPARLSYRSIGMQGPADFEIELSDYKDASGLRLPHLEVTSQNGQKAIEKTVTNRTLNTGVDPSAFKRPGA
jgi:zinc protease